MGFQKKFWNISSPAWPVRYPCGQLHRTTRRRFCLNAETRSRNTRRRRTSQDQRFPPLAKAEPLCRIFRCQLKKSLSASVTACLSVMDAENKTKNLQKANTAVPNKNFRDVAFDACKACESFSPSFAYIRVPVSPGS